MACENCSNHRDDIWLYCQCAIGITKLQSVTMQVCFSSFLLKGDGESQRKLYRLLGGGGGGIRICGQSMWQTREIWGHALMGILILDLLLDAI